MDFNRKVSATVSRNGDLVADCWIEILLKKAAGNSYYPAEGIIQDLEVELGGQRIDKYNHSFARCYNEMMRQTSQEKNAYRRCTDWVDGEAVGNVKRFYGKSFAMRDLCLSPMPQLHPHH